MQLPDVSTPAKAAAVGLENMIRCKPMETGVLIDDSGKTVIKRIGLPNSVRFTNGELLLATGMTFTHNHPGGAGPSLEACKEQRGRFLTRLVWTDRLSDAQNR